MTSGHLEVITGTMFSGKTDELIRRLRRVTIAGQPFIVFKPATDTRSEGGFIKSYDGFKLPAHEISEEKPEELVDILRKEERALGKKMSVIAVDEAQFFARGPNIVKVVSDLVGGNYRVIVAGLDRDFRGEPFGAMPDLLAIADEAIKLTAVCKRCGSHEARFPQRLIDGRPASYDSPLLLIGGEESYEARCRGCFVLPGKPPSLA